MSAEETVAAALQEGVGFLRSGRAEEALAPLRSACDALRDAPDLQDVCARAHSLLAQALLDHGDPQAARDAAHQALRVLRALDDSEGLAEVRSLDEQIGAALDRDRRNRQAVNAAADLATQTAEELEATAQSALARADVLLKHADALRKVGESARAKHSAQRALHHADAPREQILARIVLAELGEVERLGEALTIADRAGETQLVSLVARAAELTGFDLGSETIGGRPSEIDP